QRVRYTLQLGRRKRLSDHVVAERSPYDGEQAERRSNQRFPARINKLFSNHRHPPSCTPGTGPPDLVPPRRCRASRVRSLEYFELTHLRHHLPLRVRCALPARCALRQASLSARPTAGLWETRHTQASTPSGSASNGPVRR